MGRNYYWKPEPKPCATCGHDPSEALHIGKKSGGWQFSFRGYSHIKTKAEWLEVLRGRGVIEDEYGLEVSLPEMERVFAIKGLNHFVHLNLEKSDSDWLDPEGNSFTACEFF